MSSNNPDLSGRTILITGATAGIGREAALTLARHGATILLLGRDEKKLNALYDEMTALGLPTPAVVPFNLLQITPELAESLAESLSASLPHLDGLLHNAAYLGTLSPLTHYDPSEWLKVMQVNLNAPFLLTKALLPLLKTAPHASVVFTLADEGLAGRAYWGAYGVSKFASNGLMQILAEELELNTKVRVNAVNPGPTRTRLRAKAYPAEDPRTVPCPSEVMTPYLTLFGDEGRNMHGLTLGPTTTSKQQEAQYA